MAEEQVQPIPGTGPSTSDYYKTDSNLPERFQHPDWFQGYGQGKKQKGQENPMYQTTSVWAYGARPPTVHTMPTSYRGKSQKFSEHLGKAGMYRNRSLNTTVDKTYHEHDKAVLH